MKTGSPKVDKAFKELETSGVQMCDLLQTIQLDQHF